MSDRFDDLARRMAAPMPRRRTFAVLAGALATIVLPGTVRRGRASGDLQQLGDSADQYLLDFDTVLTTKAGFEISEMHVRVLGVPVNLGPGASFPVTKPIELLSFTGEAPAGCSYSSDVHVTKPFRVNSGRLVLSTAGGSTTITDVELNIEPGDLAGSYTWHCAQGFAQVFPVPDGYFGGTFNLAHQDDIDRAIGGIRVVSWDVSGGIGGNLSARKSYTKGEPFAERTTFTLRSAGNCPPNQRSCGSACCPDGSDCCDPGRGLCCSTSQPCCNPGPEGQCCGPDTKCAPSAQFVPGSPLPSYICCPSNRACQGECCAPDKVCVADLICCSAAGVCGANSRACCDPGVCCGTGCCPSADLGFACCNGACVDIWHDPKNCGACGHACPPQGNNPYPYFCAQGVCVAGRGRAYMSAITRN